MAYSKLLTYRLARDIEIMMPDGHKDVWPKGETFIYVTKHILYDGPSFVSVMDGSILSRKVIEKFERRMKCKYMLSPVEWRAQK